MDIQIAQKELRKILYDYAIVGKYLALSAGIAENTFSRFINGGDGLRLKSWFDLIAQLPPKAREEYIMAVFLLPKLENLSTEAQNALFLELAVKLVETKAEDKKNNEAVDSNSRSKCQARN